MKIPTTSQCFKLIREMNMMEHIVDHSVMVGNVAICLGRHLQQAFPSLDIKLLASAALLHDITKTRSFDTGEVHSETGGLLMEKLGYPEVGNIIRQHVVLDQISLDCPVSEQEIVNYSDKRVLHDQVVSLDRRLEYIQIRYGSNEKFRARIQQMIDATRILEDKLFRNLPFLPSELGGEVVTDIRKS